MRWHALLPFGDWPICSVTNNYTRPKMVGTVKDQIITGKLALEIKNKKENSFFTDFGYTDRSIDGIEYVQEYDNTYEVQEIRYDSFISSTC